MRRATKRIKIKVKGEQANAEENFSKSVRAAKNCTATGQRSASPLPQRIVPQACAQPPVDLLPPPPPVFLTDVRQTSLSFSWSLRRAQQPRKSWRQDFQLALEMTNSNKWTLPSITNNKKHGDYKSNGQILRHSGASVVTTAVLIVVVVVMVVVSMRASLEARAPPRWSEQEQRALYIVARRRIWALFRSSPAAVCCCCCCCSSSTGHFLPRTRLLAS